MVFDRYYTRTGCTPQVPGLLGAFLNSIVLLSSLNMNSKMSKKKVSKSFTLIEMLIVIVIIGILAAALIPRMMSVQ